MRQRPIIRIRAIVKGKTAYIDVKATAKNADRVDKPLRDFICESTGALVSVERSRMSRRYTVKWYTHKLATVCAGLVCGDLVEARRG